MVEILTYSDKDFILPRWDKDIILKYQADMLLEFLPSWQKVPINNNRPSRYNLYSQIYSNENDFLTEFENIKNAISKFIQQLNESEKTISRIDCWVEQSDDINDILYRRKTKANWIFSDTFRELDVTLNVYGNKFTRENNGPVKIKKKYFVFRLDSPWGSI